MAKYESSLNNIKPPTIQLLFKYKYVKIEHNSNLSRNQEVPEGEL